MLARDRNFPALEAALKELADDELFLAAVRSDKAVAGAAGGRIEVEFAPQPENCDIEIDGKYVGGSPKTLALPAGKEVKVRIKKGGYESWESVIVPESGLRITPELDRR
jgi:PEGA domain